MKFVRIACAATLAIGTIAVVIPSAQATTFTVSAGQSIQTAIDNASPGDTISIGPGTYRETVVVYKDDLTLVGHNTVIQPPAGSTDDWVVCVSLDSSCPDSPLGTISGVTITGITVQKGRDEGFLLNETDGVTLSNDHANNNAEDGFGVLGTNVTLSSDTATGNSFGFDVFESDGVTLTGLHASNNRIAGIAEFLVEDVTVRNSISTSNCDGIQMIEAFGTEPGGVVVSNNVFGSNTKACPNLIFLPASKGAGAYVDGAENLVFTNNAIQGNGRAKGNQFTGGLVVVSTPGEAGNVFSENSFANNLPFDIRADSTDPSVNDFENNACHTSKPSGLCP